MKQKTNRLISHISHLYIRFVASYFGDYKLLRKKRAVLDEQKLKKHSI